MKKSKEYKVYHFELLKQILNKCFKIEKWGKNYFARIGKETTASKIVFRFVMGF